MLLYHRMAINVQFYNQTRTYFGRYWAKGINSSSLLQLIGRSRVLFRSRQTERHRRPVILGRPEQALVDNHIFCISMSCTFFSIMQLWPDLATDGRNSNYSNKWAVRGWYIQLARRQTLLKLNPWWMGHCRSCIHWLLCAGIITVSMWGSETTFLEEH